MSTCFCSRRPRGTTTMPTRCGSPAEYGFRPTKGGNIYDRVGSGTSAPVKTPGVLTYGGDPSTGRNLRSRLDDPLRPLPRRPLRHLPARPRLRAASRRARVRRAAAGRAGRRGRAGRARLAAMTTSPRSRESKREAPTPHRRGTGRGRVTSDMAFIPLRPRPAGNHRAPAPPAPVPCTVLDPFAGSGTSGMVAEQLGRHATLIELSHLHPRWPAPAPPNAASSPLPGRDGPPRPRHPLRRPRPRRRPGPRPPRLRLGHRRPRRPRHRPPPHRPHLTPPLTHRA